MQKIYHGLNRSVANNSKWGVAIYPFCFFLLLTHNGAPAMNISSEWHVTAKYGIPNYPSKSQYYPHPPSLPKAQDLCGRGNGKAVRAKGQGFLDTMVNLTYELALVVTACIHKICASSSNTTSQQPGGGEHEVLSVSEEQLVIDSCRERESVIFKGVHPSRINMLQSGTPHLNVHE